MVPQCGDPVADAGRHVVRRGVVQGTVRAYPGQQFGGARPGLRRLGIGVGGQLDRVADRRDVRVQRVHLGDLRRQRAVHHQVGRLAAGLGRLARGPFGLRRRLPHPLVERGQLGRELGGGRWALGEQCGPLAVERGASAQHRQRLADPIQPARLRARLAAVAAEPIALLLGPPGLLDRVAEHRRCQRVVLDPLAQPAQFGQSRVDPLVLPARLVQLVGALLQTGQHLAESGRGARLEQRPPHVALASEQFRAALAQPGVVQREDVPEVVAAHAREQSGQLGLGEHRAVRAGERVFVPLVPHHVEHAPALVPHQRAELEVAHRVHEVVRGLPVHAVQELVQGMPHGGLAGLVRAADHVYARGTELDVPVGEAAERDQVEPIDPHPDSPSVPVTSAVSRSTA